jgi:hypothetical protein
MRLARWTIELSAVIGAMGAAVAVVPPIAGDSAAAHLTRATTTGSSRLSAIPSHNGVYQASLVAPFDPTDRYGSHIWTVEIRTAAGAPVDDAVLALESWTPDDDRVPATRPRVTAHLGDGRYRVEGLRFERRGWWNVRLQIAAAGGTDSLAFNLVR